MKIHRRLLVPILLVSLALSGCGTKNTEEQSEQTSEVTQEVQSSTVQQEEEMFPENQEYFQEEYDEAVKQRDISQEIECTPRDKQSECEIR
jgi:Tfp pilus assembly protein PilP